MNKKHIITLALAVGILGVGYSAYAAIYLNSPSSCTGSWNMCSNAYGSDDTYATTTNAVGTWGTYNFSIPSNTASISVEIGVEGHLTKVGAHCPSNAFKVSVSKNGGVTFGPDHTVSLGCPADNTTWVDVTNDFGSAWTSTDFTNANIVVRASCSYGFGCFLDWMPVKVTTTP